MLLSLYVEEIGPSTNCIGGCVGPKVGLDMTVAKRKICASVGNQTVFRPMADYYTELSRLKNTRSVD